MKKICLMRNPELFQGKKQLKKNKDYFEGWYFKTTNNEKGISFIPGININKREKKAFIQIITNDNSYFVDYDILDFKYSCSPFYIKIGNNFFSKEKIHIDIHDISQNLIAYGDIKYSSSKNINTNSFNPNIMGPFSYIPFMECNHAILSMKNKANGFLNINQEKIIFHNDYGYIEKDWGCSFPKKYIWCQGNHFENEGASFMISIANIPFKIFHFRGIICSLIINNREYRFATYNCTKLVKCNIEDTSLDITLKKGHYYLDVKADYPSALKLSAPVKGKMEKDIFESISASIIVTLKKDNDVVFSGISKNCGLEIVR